MLQFNFKIARFAGSVNTAANFFSGLELKVTKKIHLEIREDVQTTTIKVTTSSSDVSDEEQFLFTQRDGGDETEEQILQRQKTIAEKSNRMGSKSGTILNEAQYQSVHKD